MEEIKFRAWFAVKPDWCNQMFYSDEEPAGLGDWFSECAYSKIDIVYMQFTNRKDKNKIEIYDGDVIQSACEFVNLRTQKPTGKMSIKNYIVKWDVDECRWGRWDIKKGRFSLLAGLGKKHIEKWYSVIGNIYKNPELLKGE